MQIKQYPIIDLTSLKPVESEETQEEVVMLKEEIIPTTTIDIAAIKKEAFLCGKSEAASELENQRAMYDQKLLAVMETLKEKFNSIESELQQSKEVLINESIELCVTIAKKIIDKSFENIGVELIKNFLSDQLPPFYGESLITIKVAPEYVERVKKYIQDVVYKKSHNLEVEILFDESIGAGDCIIEVAGGRICRDKNKMLMQLDKLLSNYYSKDLYNKGYLSHSGNNN